MYNYDKLVRGVVDATVINVPIPLEERKDSGLKVLRNHCMK